MTKNGVYWHLMAQIQRDNLPEKNRRQLDRLVESLEGLPPERWPPRKAVRLKGEPPAYMLKLPEGYRVFVTPTPDNGMEVQTIMHEEAIRWLRDSDDEEGN